MSIYEEYGAYNVPNGYAGSLDNFIEQPLKKWQIITALGVIAAGVLMALNISDVPDNTKRDNQIEISYDVMSGSQLIDESIICDNKDSVDYEQAQNSSQTNFNTVATALNTIRTCQVTMFGAQSVQIELSRTTQKQKLNYV